MAPRSQWRCLVLMALLASAQAAGGLDDFSNNLFSDLAPLLALFGERVTMQFMSQSLGWADCVALAMAPLGVITIVVSAIRVGGPMRLKAVIGRAKENMSVAEMELMSSTSREVCEMYNGESIVRCQGVAPVWEYICLVPQSTKAADSEAEGANGTGALPKFEFKTLKQAVAAGLLFPEGKTKGSDSNENIGSNGEVPTESPEGPVASVQNEDRIPPVARSTAVRRNLSRIRPWFRRGRGPMSEAPEVSLELGSIHQHANASHTNRNNNAVQPSVEPFEEPEEATQENPEDASHPGPRSIIVIRNTGLEAPNISLNLSESRSRTSIRSVAIMGVLLQLFVVTLFGVITYGPSYVRDDFKKDEKAAFDHAFPLAAGGTVLLVTGLLLCAHVVESSTNEQRYEASSDYQIHIYWLQQGQTVNDQIFESFATFPSSPRTSFITSRRGRDFEKGKDIKKLQFKTTIGVVISLAGFITQFVGLRAMNAAASLAQLGAVGLMTVTRALVRPGFASSIEKAKLLPGHEIDWLAWKLIKERHNNSGAHDASETQNKSTNLQSLDDGRPGEKRPTTSAKASKDTQTESRNSPGSWNIVTGKDSEYHPFKSCNDPHGPVRHSSKLLDVRRELSKLANFQKDSSKIPLNLATAMEKILTVFFPVGPDTTDCNTFLWDVKTFYKGITPNAESNDTMGFQLKMVYDTKLSSWKVMADDLDAVLSLWTYTATGRDKEHEVAQSASDFEHLNSENDSWLRDKIHPASLKILCPSDAKTREELVRDLEAWAPKAWRLMFHARETSTLQPGPFKKSFDQNRVVGYNSQSQTTTESQLAERQFGIDIGLYPGTSRSGHWAIETRDALDVLYAKDLLFHFLFSAAKTLQTPVRGPTETSTPLAKFDSWLDVFIYHQGDGACKNQHLDDIIGSITNLELGLEHEVTLSVVLTISLEDKLPLPYDMFESSRDQKIQARKERNWRRLNAMDYHRLGRLVRERFERFSNARPRKALFQHLFAFLVDHAEDVEVESSSMCAEDRTDPDFRSHRGNVLESLRALKHCAMFDQLESLYKVQGRNMKFLEDLKSEIFGTQPSSPNGTESLGPLDYVFPHSSVSILHREAMKPDGNPDLCGNIGHLINQPDTFGLMPLHHALRTGNSHMVDYLIGRGADVEAKDFRGHTALHYACGFRDRSVILLLINMVRPRPRFDVQGADGAFPSHIAAANGNHKSLAFFSRNADELKSFGVPEDVWKAKDFHGRLPVHWAVMAGNTHLFSGDGPKTTLARYVNDADDYGWTALHLAVLHGRNAIVRELCSENWDGDVSVDKDKTDAKGLTAYQLARLNLAEGKGNPEAAEILRKAGARTEF